MPSAHLSVRKDQTLLIARRVLMVITIKKHVSDEISSLLTQADVSNLCLFSLLAILDGISLRSPFSLALKNRVFAVKLDTRERL